MHFAVIFAACLATAFCQEKGFYFGGPYLGSCGPDGYYYLSSNSFVQCHGGRAIHQKCAPGTENSPLEYFTQNSYKTMSIFCDINLNNDKNAPLRIKMVDESPEANDIISENNMDDMDDGYDGYGDMEGNPEEYTHNKDTENGDAGVTEREDNGNERETPDEDAQGAQKEVKMEEDIIHDENEPAHVVEVEREVEVDSYTPVNEEVQDNQIEEPVVEVYDMADEKEQVEEEERVPKMNEFYLYPFHYYKAPSKSYYGYPYGYVQHPYFLQYLAKYHHMQNHK